MQAKENPESPQPMGNPVVPAFRPEPTRVRPPKHWFQYEPKAEPMARIYYQRDTAKLPNPVQWSCMIARSAVEALDGYRSPAQLDRWIAPNLFAALKRRCQLTQRLNKQPTRQLPARVERAHLQAFPDGKVQAAVTVRHNSNIRSVALELTAFRSKWQVTALEIG